MKKSALVITYHVKNCKRVGGFHYFIKYLQEFSYDVDWVTSPVSITWLFHKNDKENAKNLFDLWRGMEYEEIGVKMRHFATPILIPARIAKCLRLKIEKYYWPAWKKLRKRLKVNYDVILVEGVGCQYALELKRDYPNARIIYRPSDIVETFSDVPNALSLEKQMIEISDVTLCVDENQVEYYKKVVDEDVKIDILRNPLATNKDKDLLSKWLPQEESRKTVVYLGTSFVDLDLIEYAALHNKDADFIIIGPFARSSYDNVKYLGTLSKEEFLPYLKTASVGINPMLLDEKRKKNNILVGYTRKILSYMQYLMPIVTTGSTNYLDVNGFFVAHNKEEFANYIEQALAYSLEEREMLKDGYMRVMDVFLEDNCKLQFGALIND